MFVIEIEIRYFTSSKLPLYKAKVTGFHFLVSGYSDISSGFGVILSIANTVLLSLIPLTYSI